MRTELWTDFVCTKPEMKVFVDNRVNLKYAYYDKHGKVVVVIAVDARNAPWSAQTEHADAIPAARVALSAAEFRHLGIAKAKGGVLKPSRELAASRKVEHS